MPLLCQLIIKHPSNKVNIVKAITLSLINTTTTNTATLDVFS